ncbi:EAL domain-containing protein [Aerophototrophica crusticola]|uniref:EAL domain-containing protein n=1 Tax=Aerophototrophica crusticola TaxID=1709002 RepID=A0A858RAR2_9PROT|nr:EAL domain-containing protein [Rhodospirillaceae bacterium B3]
MTTLRHIAFATLYVALAFAVAVTLPLTGGVDRLVGLLFGLVVFLAGALLHEFWARNAEREALEEELWHLRKTQDEMRIVLLHLEEKLRGGIAAPAAAPLVPPPVPARPELDSVVSEARMLETLAGQLPVRRPGGRVEPVFGGPATPVAEAGVDADAVLEMVRTALRSDRVDIFLQPMVSLPQRKHRYYEVFSRIRGDDGSHLPPDRYLDVAANAGLIAAIDNMLLFRCIQLIRETEKRHQTVGFFCNISAASLDDAGFMREFVTYMGQHPSLVNKLVFELGQADLMRGGVFATGFLDGLRRLGFRFSMDQVTHLDVDWDQLARHEIRFVKLDAARLLDPAGRFADPAAFKALKGQLDRNAIDLVVEKIETDRQLLDLLDLSVDFGQGYLFGEPRLAKKLG